MSVDGQWKGWPQWPAEEFRLIHRYYEPRFE